MVWAPVVASVLVGLITGGVALVGQLIVAYNTLSAKRVEVLFTKKVEAYKSVLDKAIEFGADRGAEAKYLALQSAIHEAVIVASREVADVLDAIPSISLHTAANRLRTAEPDEVVGVQTHEWYRAQERLKEAMRLDIGRLADPKLATLRELFRALLGRQG